MNLISRIKNAANHVLYNAEKPLTSADMLNAMVNKASVAEHAITKLEVGETLTPSELKELQWSVGMVVDTLEYVYKLKAPKKDENSL